MNLKLRRWGDALITLEILALAGGLRNGVLASHRDNIAFVLSYLSFGIIGILLVILSFHTGKKEKK